MVALYQEMREHDNKPPHPTLLQPLQGQENKTGQPKTTTYAQVVSGNNA